MGLLDRMKELGAAAAAKVVAEAPGVASRALAFGSAAASAAASVAAGAYENVRDFAADKLKGSHFSEADVDQAAGALEMLQLGVEKSDGTFRPLASDERLQMSRIILAATLADDDVSADVNDDGDD